MFWDRVACVYNIFANVINRKANRALCAADTHATEALGGDCCDYWYVGDKSPVLEEYKDIERI